MSTGQQVFFYWMAASAVLGVGLYALRPSRGEMVDDWKGWLGLLVSWLLVFLTGILAVCVSVLAYFVWAVLGKIA